MGLQHTDFITLFDQWASTYDQTVFRPDPVDGFEEYPYVLGRVASLAEAGPGIRILDVGSGTGNLTAVLHERGASITAVEPSGEMRSQTRRKLPNVPVIDGHFLSVPLPAASQDAVVSSYAFHHLPDTDKARGARELLRMVRSGGRVVIGDVVWANEAARAAMIRKCRAQGKLDLIKEIEEEYYPTIGLLTGIFAAEGCSVYVEQLTEWVWVVMAAKQPHLASQAQP